ncbi:phage tail sheath subtilisin-like domain-containing protein [Nodularia spumigena CS-590/02]|uniref:phage tail sheath family protein n=1 Tax=Nodularia spumigena TaxID=70799 RepID=UPI00233082AA|nr:phage tail sheath subtilisin-like domain-containing protein [Nodularia spumigena]MDB9327573.1 phage tail sheath subtilisin-like domain-containing protein [Nodularia spumigena CS-590/02]
MPYTPPGVYLEEIFPKPEVILPSGVPGFIGFAAAKKPEDKKDGVMQLHRKQELDEKLNFPEDGYLKASVIGFFDNGGTCCYVAFADLTIEKQETLEKAIKALALLTDIDLMAIPDAMYLLPLLPDDPIRKEVITLVQWQEQANKAVPEVIKLQRSLMQHCTDQGDRFAILDALPEKISKSVSQQCNAIKANQNLQKPVNGALYYPWLQNAQGRWVPPCGHIAGIFARSDRTRGVFKAPANEEIRDAVNLEVLIENSDQGDLNSQGINCLRAFPGRGIRVWGARTLSNDSNWRYINVRRLLIAITRWIDLNIVWAAFEPNTPQLWVRIQRELSGYLTQLWRVGALKGETPEQAFYVKCDAEINPPESREMGNVFTEIGFAPSLPAEFIFVRITHRANTTELS